MEILGNDAKLGHKFHGNPPTLCVESNPPISSHLWQLRNNKWNGWNTQQKKHWSWLG